MRANRQSMHNAMRLKIGNSVIKDVRRAPESTARGASRIIDANQIEFNNVAGTMPRVGRIRELSRVDLSRAM